MYPPKTPMDGIYRVKILAVRQDDAAHYIRYNVSVGPWCWMGYLYASAHLAAIAAKADRPWSHSIIILPKYLPAGDYTTSNSNVIVDRNDNILERYKSFASSGR